MHAKITITSSNVVSTVGSWSFPRFVTFAETLGAWKDTTTAVVSHFSVIRIVRNRKPTCSQITVEYRDYHHLSRFEVAGGKRISQHLSGQAGLLLSLHCGEEVLQLLEGFLGTFFLEEMATIETASGNR